MDIDFNIDMSEKEKKYVALAVGGVLALVVLSVVGIPLLNNSPADTANDLNNNTDRVINNSTNDTIGNETPDNNNSSGETVSLGPGYTDESIENNTQLIESHNESFKDFRSYELVLNVSQESESGPSRDIQRRFKYERTENAEIALSTAIRGNLTAKQYFNFTEMTSYSRRAFVSNGTRQVQYQQPSVEERPTYKFAANTYLFSRLRTINTSYAGQTTFNGMSVYEYQITEFDSRAVDVPLRNVTVGGSLYITEDNTIVSLQMTIVRQTGSGQTIAQHIFEVKNINGTTVEKPDWVDTARNQSENG